jgi:hypothetical protein
VVTPASTSDTGLGESRRGTIALPRNSPVQSWFNSALLYRSIPDIAPNDVARVNNAPTLLYDVTLKIFIGKCSSDLVVQRCQPDTRQLENFASRYVSQTKNLLSEWHKYPAFNPRVTTVIYKDNVLDLGQYNGTDLTSLFNCLWKQTIPEFHINFEPPPGPPPPARGVMAHGAPYIGHN